MANYHLAILKRPYLDAILAGQKPIESRFSKIRCGPFGQVKVGDKIFFKQSSGPVRGVATAAAVKNFENLTPNKITELKQRYNHQIRGSDEYWQSKTNCKFGVLVWLKNIEHIKPIHIIKKDWRAWVVLTEKEDFGLVKNKGAEAV